MWIRNKYKHSLILTPRKLAILSGGKTDKVTMFKTRGVVTVFLKNEMLDVIV